MDKEIKHILNDVSSLKRLKICGWSKLALALLSVPVQLRPRIKIRTSKAFVSYHYLNTTCFAVQLAAIIRWTSCTENCCPLVKLQSFAF